MAGVLYYLFLSYTPLAAPNSYSWFEFDRWKANLGTKNVRCLFVSCSLTMNPIKYPVSYKIDHCMHGKVVRGIEAWKQSETDMMVMKGMSIQVAQCQTAE